MRYLDAPPPQIVAAVNAGVIPSVDALFDMDDVQILRVPGLAHKALRWVRAQQYTCPCGRPTNEHAV